MKKIWIVLFISLSVNAADGKKCLEGDCVNGIGKLENIEDGMVFECKFKNSKPEGVVKAHHKDKPDVISTFHFINGKLDITKPVSEWSDESNHYEGYYNADYERHGKGKDYYNVDGINCIHDGMFANGKKHGPGKITCDNESSDSGEWRNDRKYFLTTPKFIFQSKKLPEKWIGGTVSGTFTFKQFRGVDEISTDMKEKIGLIDDYNLNEYIIAEVHYNTGDVFGQRFWLLVPRDLEKKIDTIAQSQKQLVIMNGIALGMVKLTFSEFPVLLVEKIQ